MIFFKKRTINIYIIRQHSEDRDKSISKSSPDTILYNSKNKNKLGLFIDYYITYLFAQMNKCTFGRVKRYISSRHYEPM